MPRISESAKVLKKFESCGDDVKFYFEYIPDIINELDIGSIALGYCFQQIESGHRRALYAGLVRKYRFHPDATWEAIDRHEMYLSDFKKLYAFASLKPLKNSIFDALKQAQIVRNRVTHGQDVSSKEIWEAVAVCLQYAEDFNTENLQKSGFNVFGSLQGVTSNKARPTQEREISELALKGIGF